MGFEPTQLALVELESTPLDHSGKVSLVTAGCKAIGNVRTSSVMATGYCRCRIERKEPPRGLEEMVGLKFSTGAGAAEMYCNMLPTCGGARSPSGHKQCLGT